MIVDSGTTLVYLPNKLAVEINDLYDPPSVYNENYGVFENDCTATPPTFAITIGKYSTVRRYFKTCVLTPYPPLLQVARTSRLVPTSCYPKASSASSRMGVV